jgi:hypothetical protein
MKLSYEEVINKLKISVYHQSYKRDGDKYIYGVERWVAEVWSPRKATAEGASPREAVENLLSDLQIINE